MHILIVKTSSLGDLVHTLPALSDAQDALPLLRCDWLAERAYAEIPRWHPAVETVIESDLRGWRRQPLRTLFDGEWARFSTGLRQTSYDLVIDAQGLVKSAWLARRARGPLAGPDRHGAREPLAAWFYDRPCAVPKHDDAHAIDRLRILFAQALGYPLPLTPAAAGLRVAQFSRPALPTPYAVLLHGTTWPGKRWPVTQWSLLAAWLALRGVRPVLTWGNAAERANAQVIADACNGVVLPPLGLTELAGWLAHARVSVGVDTGLAHLAAALGTPQVTLYGPTLPQLTGAVGANQVWLRADDSVSIDRERSTEIAIERVQDAVNELLGAG